MRTFIVPLVPLFKTGVRTATEEQSWTIASPDQVWCCTEIAPRLSGLRVTDSGYGATVLSGVGPERRVREFGHHQPQEVHS